ncbi:2203_t:CDS:2, partial [Funneliformis mosseae]
NLGSLKIGHFNEKSGLIKSIVTHHYKAILSRKVKKRGSLAGLVCIGHRVRQWSKTIFTYPSPSVTVIFLVLPLPTHSNTYVAS